MPCLQYILYFLIHGILLTELQASEAEKRLVEYLFNKNNHNIMVRPVKNSSDTLNVTIQLSLYKLAELIEMSQEVDFSVWLRTEWNDYQMRWDPEKYDGIEDITVRPHNVWLPDIVLYNNAHEDNAQYGGNMDTLKTRIKVSHTGNMYWSAPLFLRAKCYFRVDDFPFDTQMCYLKFGSWTHPVTKLNLLPGGIDTTNFLPCSEWNLKKVGTTSHLLAYNSTPRELYPDVTFEMTFERKSLFYVTNLIFPMFLITALTILTFVLPNESGERIGLSVTLMLATTVFMLLVAQTTPDSSEGLPIVGKYFIFCLLVIFSIIVFLCFISRMYNRGPTDRPMSKWMRRWIFNYLSLVLHIRSTDEENKEETLRKEVERSSRNNSVDLKLIEGVNLKERRESDELGEHVFTVEEEWHIVAKTIDFILFVFYIIVFIIGTVACFANTSYVGTVKYNLTEPNMKQTMWT